MYTTGVDANRGIDLLSSKQVARRLSISVRTVWRLLKRGALPAPLRYSRKLVRWRTADIESFVAAAPPAEAHATASDALLSVITPGTAGV